MSTLTVFSDASDGLLDGSDATYLTARSGSGTLSADAASITTNIGQRLQLGVYHCYESFFRFDTSPLTAAASISAAVLSLWVTSDLSTTNDFIARARLFDWGTTLTTADYIAGASLTGNTLLAHFDTSGTVTAGAYNAFTDDALPANVSKTADTRIVVASNREESGTVPTGTELIVVSSGDETGTTQDPKLVVTYTMPTGRGTIRSVNQAVHRAASW